jgi:hypothetical protein
MEHYGELLSILACRKAVRIACIAVVHAGTAPCPWMMQKYNIHVEGQRGTAIRRRLFLNAPNLITINDQNAWGDK